MARVGLTFHADTSGAGTKHPDTGSGIVDSEDAGSTTRTAGAAVHTRTAGATTVHTEPIGTLALYPCPTASSMHANSIGSVCLAVHPMCACNRVAGYTGAGLAITIHA